MSKKIKNINLNLAGTYTDGDWEEFATEVMRTKGIYKYHKSAISKDIIKAINKQNEG